MKGISLWPDPLYPEIHVFKLRPDRLVKLQIGQVFGSNLPQKPVVKSSIKPNKNSSLTKNRLEPVFPFFYLEGFFFL